MALGVGRKSTSVAVRFIESVYIANSALFILRVPKGSLDSLRDVMSSV